MSHTGPKPPGWNADALLQDTNDLVDRMKVAYRDSPKKAATVLANALGIICAQAEGCGNPDCVACAMDMCATMNHVVIRAAIAELEREP